MSNSGGNNGDIIDLGPGDYTVVNRAPQPQAAVPAGPNLTGQTAAAPSSTGPTLRGTGASARPASGPTLSGAPPKKSGLPLWPLLAGAAAVAFVLLNLGKDETAKAPAPVPEEPATPLASQFFTAQSNVPLLKTPPKGEAGIAFGTISRDSCVQAFTDYNEENPKNGWLHVTFTTESGKLYSGYVDDKALKGDKAKTENTCLGSFAP